MESFAFTLKMKLGCSLNLQSGKSENDLIELRKIIFAKSLYLKRPGPFKVMDLEASFTSSDIHIFIHIKNAYLLTLSTSPILWSSVILRITLKSDRGLEFLITALKSQGIFIVPSLVLIPCL